MGFRRFCQVSTLALGILPLGASALTMTACSTAAQAAVWTYQATIA